MSSLFAPKIPEPPIIVPDASKQVKIDEERRKNLIEARGSGHASTILSNSRRGGFDNRPLLGQAASILGGA
jgi:hypothetical protein